MTKRSVLTIIIVIVILGGALWLFDQLGVPFNQPEPEETKDDIVVLLENLQKETGIDFSSVEDSEIDWQIKKEEGARQISLVAKSFEAERISDQKYQMIDSFLKKNGFEIDVYNISAGTISGATGYRREETVCSVIGGVTGYQEATGQWIPSEPDKKDVRVKCGQGGSQVIPTITKEEEVKKLFADKYGKKMSEININISQETKNHLRGSVVFGSGGPGEGGIFLAAKVNNQWQLVFDGNGAISCEQLSRYDFPEEMKFDCISTQSIETKINSEFRIVLEANPTTGYQWKIDFDSQLINLVDQDYQPNSPELVGSGGLETFNFKAIETGETEIIFSYLRPWEKDKTPLEERAYQIIIK